MSPDRFYADGLLKIHHLLEQNMIHLNYPMFCNKHFASIEQNLANKIPVTNDHYSQYLKDHINQKESFFFAPITSNEIENEILALPTNKSYGLYSCPVSLLKASRHLISEHLVRIINMSVQTGCYPSKLKLSKIVPVYKSDDDTDPNNYRPIALLSIFNVIFEKLIYKRFLHNMPF